jgi:hypothetical protein
MTPFPQQSNFLFSPRHRRGLAGLVSSERTGHAFAQFARLGPRCRVSATCLKSNGRCTFGPSPVGQLHRVRIRTHVASSEHAARRSLPAFALSSICRFSDCRAGSWDKAVSPLIRVVHGDGTDAEAENVAAVVARAGPRGHWVNFHPSLSASPGLAGNALEKLRSGRLGTGE